MESSRTKNSALNASVSAICKIIYIIITFVCRTAFIKTLGTEYLGINGLFSNILTILSLAELGVGNAIIFKLYKPIASDDKEKIKTYMNFYKKVYSYIGIIVFVLGIAIIPFLNFIITDPPNIDVNLYFIYFLFLFNSAISYFFVYKKSIIEGHQKNYIYNLIYTGVMILQNIVQIILLYITHNYILYLLLLITGTILTNVITAYKADKMYPYIKEKKYTKISKEEQTSIFNDVKSIVLYKIGGVLSNGTDNIIITKFIGVATVGLLSNYNMILTAIKSLLSAFFDGFTASVGNLNTIKETEKKEAIYYQIIMLSFFIYGYIAVGIGLLMDRFITIWIGKKYVLGLSISIVLAFDMYIDGMRYANYTFRNTMGLFKKGRLIPLISSTSNVISSIILVKPLGIFGVLLATGITRLFIMTMIDPYLLHKYGFHTSCKKFYINYIFYFIVASVDLIVCYLIISNIKLTGILGFIVCGVIVTIITGIIFIGSTFYTKEFKELKKKILNLMSKKIFGRK